jgi:hypothetical protein
VLGVTSAVAPWAFGFIPTPGLADWAVAPIARAREVRVMFLSTAMIALAVVSVVSGELRDEYLPQSNQPAVELFK